ncbi:hypothetical protein Avbf_05222, partial [Armadillidium vulgare]
YKLYGIKQLGSGSSKSVPRIELQCITPTSIEDLREMTKKTKLKSVGDEWNIIYLSFLVFLP